MSRGRATTSSPPKSRPCSPRATTTVPSRSAPTSAPTRTAPASSRRPSASSATPDSAARPIPSRTTAKATASCRRASRRHGSRASGQNSDGAHVGGVRALGALFLLVFDLRALGKRLEAAAGDRGVVDEEVLASVVWFDEAVALVVAEPLHGSSGHSGPPVDGAARRGGCWATTANRSHCFPLSGAPSACRHPRPSLGASQPVARGSGR